MLGRQEDAGRREEEAPVPPQGPRGRGEESSRPRAVQGARAGAGGASGQEPGRAPAGRPLPRDRRRLGALAEELAASYFQQIGCAVVARNVRCPWGEADLIVRDGQEWVVVEVRARRGCRRGSPEQSVDRRKFHRLRAVGEWWLGRTGRRGQPWRIDLVTVRWPGPWDGGGARAPAPVLRHYRRLEGGADR